MIGHLRTPLVATIAALFALSACSGGSSSSGLPHAAGNPNTTYTGPASLADFSWGKDYLAQSRYLGPSSFGSATVEVQVRMQNEQGLLQYAQQVSDPHSPLYRRFLTPQEIGDRFGASPADYAAAAQYFQSYGLAVGGWPQRELLHVSGTQAHLEAAFGTTFGGYTRAGQNFIAPITAPHFSQPVPVVAVLGLMDAHVNKPYIIIPPRGSNGDFFGYSSQQIANGFDFTGAYKAGYTGSGITVGIIGTGPISTGAKSDVAAYGALFHTPVASVTIVPAVVQPATAANGSTGTCKVDVCTSGTTGLATPPPVTAPCSATQASNYPTATCNPEDGEAQLDTEQVASLAYGANVLFYLAFNKTDCTATGNPFSCPVGAIGVQGLFIADDEIQQAIADDTADVLSLSYGGGEINQGDSYVCASGSGCTKGTGIGPTEFASLAAEGIAVFVSSGDTGAEECSSPTGGPLASPCVSYPSGDPSVVSVGGVNAPMNNFGQLISQITAWGDLTTGGGDGSFLNNVGSGGGTSQVFTAPAWQAKNIAASMREQPDIALMADPGTGPGLVMNAPFSGQTSVGASGGTSAAAPEAAAEWALVLQACKASSSCATASGAHPYRLGNPAPVLYDKLYGVNGASASYATTFYDVLAGTNNAIPPPGATPVPSPTPISGCCAAGKGYDEVTGLGVPFGGHLVQAVTGQKAP